jgi:hypothetical protein
VIKKTVFAALLACAVLSAPPARAAESDLARKLDEVIAKQDETLKQLADIRAELQVVKVRATQR